MRVEPVHERQGVKIGLSYDEGKPQYRLYVGALIAAADELGIENLELLWLAGAAQPLDRDGLDDIDGLVLTGGADVDPHRYGQNDRDGLAHLFPGRDDAEWRILESALARRLPMLAICRGMQLLNVFHGGTLVLDLADPAHELPDTERHPVQITPGSALHRLLGAAENQTSSSHHQAVAELGSGLTAVAHHDDGTVEAIEWTNPMRKPWLTAVQWHPEHMTLDEPAGGSILRGFLNAVRARSG